MSTGLAAVCPRDIRGRGGGRCERAVLHRGGDRPYGVGADAVLECVGRSMTQALRSTRPGGFAGRVGLSGGGAEPQPGPVGQPGHPLRPEHGRKEVRRIRLSAMMLGVWFGRWRTPGGDT